MKNTKKTSSVISILQTVSESTTNIGHSEFISESTTNLKSTTKTDTEINSVGQKNIISIPSARENLSKLISSLFSINPKTKNSKLKTTFGFTLVELIVVITILAILGTIAFVSFGSYSSNGRDSSRVADINSLKKSFELYNTIGGAGYPMPDSYTGITYSGGVIWYQGTFGDTAFRVVNKNLSKKIVDPLTQKEYIYSLTANKKEYQLKADFENKLGFYPANSYKLVANSYTSFADSSSGTVCYINGSYNGVVAKVNDGSEDYIIAVLSLIISDITNVANTTFTFANIDDLGSGILQCNGTNSPCNITYNAQVVWSGTLSKDNYGTLLNNIKSAYSGSNIIDQPVINNILTLTGTTTIENSIGGLVKSVEVKMETDLTPVTGICGSSNLLSFTGAPSTNLCNAGTLEFTDNTGGDGTYDWNCKGKNDGGDASCSANKIFLCGSSQVSAGGYNYNTIVDGAGKCRTTVLKHLPSSGNNRCYDNISSNCETYGRLYDWYSANSICGMLGTGWTLPTAPPVNGTGWTGNKLLGLITNLAGYSNNGTSFGGIGGYGGYWTSTYAHADAAWRISIGSDGSWVDQGWSNPTTGYTVLCIKN